MREDKKIEADFYEYLNDFSKSNGIDITSVIKMPKLVEDLRNLYLSKKNNKSSSNEKKDN
jgi:hypothetical protein